MRYPRFPRMWYPGIPGIGHPQIRHPRIPRMGYPRIPGIGQPRIPGTWHLRIPGMGYPGTPGIRHLQIRHPRIPTTGHPSTTGCSQQAPQHCWPCTRDLQPTVVIWGQSLLLAPPGLTPCHHPGLTPPAHACQPCGPPGRGDRARMQAGREIKGRRKWERWGRRGGMEQEWGG